MADTRELYVGYDPDIPCKEHGGTWEDYKRFEGDYCHQCRERLHLLADKHPAVHFTTGGQQRYFTRTERQVRELGDKRRLLDDVVREYIGEISFRDMHYDPFCRFIHRPWNQAAQDPSLAELELEPARLLELLQHVAVHYVASRTPPARVGNRIDAVLHRIECDRVAALKRTPASDCPGERIRSPRDRAQELEDHERWLEYLGVDLWKRTFGTCATRPAGKLGSCYGQ